MTQPHHSHHRAHPERVDAATVRAWLAQPDTATVLDVRTPAEFETVHIRGSYNVPLNLLDEHAEQLAPRLDRHVVLVCQSGPRAAQARQRLATVGADRVHVLDGGITAYAGSGSDGGDGDGGGKADGSLVRGRARWSLGRQVRLVAGTLVTAGLVAGLRAPSARLLSAAIGAGLTVSALTDTCTMARVLSALPYNRGPRDRTPAEVLAQLPAGAAARPAPSPTE
ncbi:rhodanese-like domain-containing protein [Pseudonocardia sp. MH-G8]|uniref:rhodanese-like domain-containing protein n=1 Tax=Pseudonocardia sp. MH-G8 TaxID=1854588 RepID=UPI000B9FD326|nr:rhodanese-like domain-containing protein [Pseudonocardia sp. MH-G8]OZM76359.1 sulfurtransferase [Pseudonocardia sp. MH-G8]